MLSSMTLVVPQVQAAAQYQIVLPFSTSWEDGQAYGRKDSVDYSNSKDFSSPKCGRVLNEVAPPNIFGYKFGIYQLKAAGKFDSSNSYCYFNLFDTTPDSIWGPPFKVKPYTFINIWYRHEGLAHCMIDAELYNSETHQYWTLRNFYKYVHIDGSGICVYIKDQNGVRIHPGYRYNDPVGSWQFASFDLSIVYEDSPHWYVTKIWIGFDNTIDPNHPTGQARTYFDMLYISYGAGNRQVTTYDDVGAYYNAWTTGSIIARTYSADPEFGGYKLELKVAISAFNDGYIKNEVGNPLYFIRPYKLRVSTTQSGAQFLDHPQPTGLNLTESKPDLGPVAELVLDAVIIIVSYKCAPAGYVLTAYQYAMKFLALAKPPDKKTYEWPHGVGWYTQGLPYYDLSKTIQGEVCLSIYGLSPSVTHSIPITFEVDYCYADYVSGLGIYPVYWATESFTLNIKWSNTPDYVNLPPEKPSTPSGETSGRPGITYSYSTSTTDPEGARVRYEFWWGDGTTTTTNWYDSGDNATASHSWSSPGTYNVMVRAQDYDGYLKGYWGRWSPPLTVNIRNPYLTVLAQDGRSLTSGYVYIDRQYRGRTGSAFAVTAGTHTVFVDNVCWGIGNFAGYRYVFLLWENGSTANPRTVTVVEDTTIKAYFDGKYCLGDIDGDGRVGPADLGKLGAAYGSRPGDSNWNSAADLDGSGAVGPADLGILGANYGKVYP